MWPDPGATPLAYVGNSGRGIEHPRAEQARAHSWRLCGPCYARLRRQRTVEEAFMWMFRHYWEKDDE